MHTVVDITVHDQALENAQAALLAARMQAGQWEGRLSSSALSTATAIVSLKLFVKAAGPAATNAELTDTCHRLVRDGCNWLLANQNPDGGWGDTTRSFSNLSTTMLCWSALGLCDPEAVEQIQRAGQWIAKAAGSLEPRVLAAALARRYGRDRSFSVPILTMCALCGRLGARAAAWKLVPQLPFELAAVPRSWFRWLRLPVVSYALPALIAIGLVRHRRRPTWNPIARIVRAAVGGKTLRVLEIIQPRGGGFLEATPLTSFVTMSLIGAGLHEHPVVVRGIDFLVRSVRDDGSWPIDTNLATWVTTLSVNALATGSAPPHLTDDDRRRIRDWLLGQQYRQTHPYTGAAPGGWAWTDLPGGVPDADDTAGALLALGKLGPADSNVLSAVEAGVRWLLDLQNRDGGMPTFCRGWGALPFDRSGADLTAHAIAAWSAWQPQLDVRLHARVDRAIRRGLDYLAANQCPDGAWAPLWFGNQRAADDENLTYGTSRVLAALAALDDAVHSQLASMKHSASDWLLASQAADGSWGGDQDGGGSVEETALAIVALSADAQSKSPSDTRHSTAIRRAAASLIAQTDHGRRFHAAPIGLYFAKLWYFEDLYPLIWSVAALRAAAS